MISLPSIAANFDLLILSALLIIINLIEALIRIVLFLLTCEEVLRKNLLKFSSKLREDELVYF